MKKKLTRTLIDTLAPPTTGDAWVWDSELDGFGVRIQPTGRKTFVLRYRTKAGTQRKETIARCGVMTPEQARAQARKILGEVATGKDPVGERRATEKPVKLPSVEDLFQAYVDSMRERGAESATEVERALLKAGNNAADALGRHQPAASITAADVVKYVGGIFDAGHPGAADKHRSYISSAYGWAIRAANDYKTKQRRNWGISANPVAAVARDKDATTTRERNLAAGELKRLWQATRPGGKGFSAEVAACVRALIATGQRVHEVLRLDGCEIDLDEAVWRMPKHKTKTKLRPHLVPLPAAILGDLKLLKGLHGDGPLFPARGGAKGERIVHQSVGQALSRWLEAESVTPFQTRDLRRTWKSRGHDAGIDRFTRDLIQQHAKNDTGSKHYDMANYLPQMREAMGKWHEWIQQHLEDAPDLQIAA